MAVTSRVLSLASSSTLAIWAMLSLACSHQQTSDAALICPEVPPIEDVRSGEAAANAAREAFVVDVSRLRDTVETLAGDDYSGRYTLEPDIDRAAKWLQDSHQANHVGPLGQSYVHPYTLKVIKGEKSPTTLHVTVKGKSRNVDSERLAPVYEAGGGKVEGELVFVGYGLKLEPPLVETPYNDLDGVDVRGKIAVVLDGAPSTIDFMTLKARVESEQAKFNQAIARIYPENAPKRRAEHLKARKAVAKIFSRYIAGKDIPPAFFEVPAVPGDTLDLDALAETLWPQLMKRPKAGYERGANWLRNRLTRLKEAGAIGAIVVTGPENYLDEEARKAATLNERQSSREVADDDLTLPSIRMLWRDFDQVVKGSGFSIAREQKQQNKELKPSGKLFAGLGVEYFVDPLIEDKAVPNVIAWIPGSDLAEQIVVVGAHFDHIGREGAGHCRPVTVGDKKDTICNGADDNGSGTAAVLELARLAKNAMPAPRRTLAFVHFSGEEMGLLGSAGFAKNPPFPIEKAVAMINIDMIGRMSSRGLFVGGLGTSEAWLGLLDSVNNQGLPAIYDAASTTRSDHAEFLKRKVPALFFFTGVHEDYHQATDEASKIDFNSMAKISQIAADVVAKLAMGAEIHWSEPAPGRGLVHYLPGDRPESIVKTIPAAPNAPAAPAAPGTN